MSRTRGGLDVLIVAGNRSFGSAVVDAVETNTETASAECVESIADTLTRAETVDGVVVDDRFAEPITVIDRLTSEHGVPVVLLTEPSENGETVARAIEAGASDVFPRVTAGAQYELVVDCIGRVSGESPPADRREHEGRYEEMLEMAGDGIVVHHPETGEVVDANQRVAELLGYDREAFLEQPLSEFQASGAGVDGQQARQMVRESAREGRREFEWPLSAADGSTVWVRVRHEVGEVGGERRVVASLHDITAQKRREREYEQMFDGVNDAITVFDPETGEIVEVNNSYHELFGYNEFERIRELGIDGLSATEEGYTGERGVRLIREVAETGEDRTVEWKGETRGGERIWLEATLAPAEIGGEQRVLSIQRDITERRELERTYQDIFDGVNDAIAMFDPETGEIVEVNKPYCEMVGYDGLERIRELGIEGLSADSERYTGERGRALVRQVSETGEPETVEWRAETAGSDRIWLEVTLSPAVIRGEERVLSIQRDITERKRRERAIRALQDATERLQSAQTPEDVATIAVEAASDALDLPMAVCWMHESDHDRLRPVAATDAAREVGLVSGFSPERYEHAVFRSGEVTEYSPSEHGTDNPLETGVLLPLGAHGLVAAGTREQTEPDSAVLDVARALADHVQTALDRVERAQAVRESERRFRMIAERIDEVIYLAEPDFSDVLYVNPAYEDIWGQPVEALYSDATAFLETADERDRERFRSEFETMLAEIDDGDPQESYEFEYRVRQPGGEVRWVHATGYVVELSGGTRRFVGIVEDITERKRREQRLEVFNRVLRHNLRNQIDVIRSHAEVLADRQADDHADRIVAAVDELAEIGTRARRTDQIMSMNERATTVDLAETLEEAIETLCPERADVSVTTDVSGAPRLQTNKRAVQIAVESALENALEHAGSAVGVAVEEAPNGYTLVVDDDGPGIPEDDLVPIEAGTETNLRHGRGLGLWQLRWSVDRINGELSFDTTDGTTVRITVPDRNGS